MTTVRKDRNMNVSSDVAKYIKTRANELVTIEEGMEALGLSPEQFRYAMRRTIEKTVLGKYIEVVSRGHSWHVGDVPGARKPKAKEETSSNPTAGIVKGLMFEHVGTTQDGTRVVSDASGKLWKLIAL